MLTNQRTDKTQHVLTESRNHRAAFAHRNQDGLLRVATRGPAQPSIVFDALANHAAFWYLTLAMLAVTLSSGCDLSSQPPEIQPPEIQPPEIGSQEIANGRSTESTPQDAGGIQSALQPQTTGGSKPQDRDLTSGQTDTSAMGSRQQRLDQADQLAAEERFDEASQILRQQLLADPADAEVLFRIANLTASLGDLDTAIEFLDSISPDNLEAGLPALGQAADWCMTQKRYNDAENRYKKILEIVPQATIAHRRLASLLNRQGRRHEAATHLQELCKLGDVRQDELHALIVLSDAMGVPEEDDPEVNNATENRKDSGVAPISDPSVVSDETDYSPLNDWGRARILFTQRKYAEAAELLRSSCNPRQILPNSSDQSRALENDVAEIPASIIAFYGRTLAESQNDGEFVNWLQLTQQYPTIKQYSEYWAAIGTYLSSQQKAEPACRALLEGLARDPTDFRCMNRLHQMLELIGKTEQAETWENRWKASREVLLANNAISDGETPDVQAMDEVASQLSGLGRNIEAVLWKMMESFHRGQNAEIINGWNQQRQQLVANNQCFPNTETNLCGMDINLFPLPELGELTQVVNQNKLALNLATKISDATPAFNNVAKKLGVDHQYKLATTPIESGFAMYHQAGGGVAVLDYDLDGKHDLYFAQGGADAPEFRSDEPNPLFRNHGREFEQVTSLAATNDLAYTIGCTAGDWNQDGFPDLITANIGINLLFLNNGDGTFTATPIPGSGNLENMPASLAIADLNGDSIPDLFEANYISDPLIDMRPERDSDGQVIEAVGPADFEPARDRIGINDGVGGFRFTPTHQDPDTTYRGLGLVVTDFDGDGTNDIFVGNDKSPNQLWKRQTENLEDNAPVTWNDVAMPLGVAFSFDGGGTASMGIASGDFDQSGSLDLHVANFQNENACLYLSRNQNFQDRAAQFRLGVPSYEVLGFGCQGIDFNLDGYLDLAVTNGHIDRYQKMSGDFLQRFQLFKNMGKELTEIDSSQNSGYISTPHVGRAMAKCDLNNDGKEDLVITHINEPTAILQNETITDNHWLQVQLIGTKSERDAVGAKVTVNFNDQNVTCWATSGDGYLCRNHSLLCFGLGETEKIDFILVNWPSGITQRFENISTDERLLIIENSDETFRL